MGLHDLLEVLRYVQANLPFIIWEFFYYTYQDIDSKCLVWIFKIASSFNEVNNIFSLDELYEGLLIISHFLKYGMRIKTILNIFVFSTQSIN